MAGKGWALEKCREESRRYCFSPVDDKCLGITGGHLPATSRDRQRCLKIPALHLEPLFPNDTWKRTMSLISRMLLNAKVF